MCRICKWIIGVCENGIHPKWISDLRHWRWEQRNAFRRMFTVRESVEYYLERLRDQPEHQYPLCDNKSVMMGMGGMGYLSFRDGITGIEYRDPDYKCYIKLNFTESIMAWVAYRRWLKVHREDQ